MTIQGMRDSLWGPTLLSACLLLAGLMVTPPALAIGVGKVEVMDIDEVGDAALIAREKAKIRSEESEDKEGGDEGVSSSGGCSDLNIGNVKTSPGQLVPRKVITIIEGPIIQQNKCR